MKEQIQQKIEEWIGEDRKVPLEFNLGWNEALQDLRTKSGQLAEKILELVVKELKEKGYIADDVQTVELVDPENVYSDGVREAKFIN